MGLRRFSDNPSATTPLTGAEVIPGLQGGDDVQFTAQDVADLAIPGAGRSVVTVLTPAAGVVTIDWALGDYFTLAPTANVTSIVFTNLPSSPAAVTLSIRFTQDTTPRTVAFPAAFDWVGGITGVVSTGSGAVDLIIISSFNQGTSWQTSIGNAYS